MCNLSPEALWIPTSGLVYNIVVITGSGRLRAGWPTFYAAGGSATSSVIT